MSTQNFMVVKLVDIVPPKREIRESMTDEGFSDLVQDINIRGLINPITVRPIVDGKFEIIAGMRRFEACKKLGWPEIPCMIREEEDRAAEFLKLAENFKREEVNSYEEGKYYARLICELGLTAGEIADSTNRSNAYVRSRLAIIEGDLLIAEAVRDGVVGLGVGLALNRIADQKLRDYYLKWAIETGATQRLVEQWVREANQQGVYATDNLPVHPPTEYQQEPQVVSYICELCRDVIDYNHIRTTFSCQRCKSVLLAQLREMEGK